MKNGIALFFSMFVFLCSAQQKETPELKEAQSDTLTEKNLTLPAIDTTATKIDGKVLFEKKDRKYQLKDDAYAAKIDSLWLKKLYEASALYDTIYSTVTASVSPANTAYEELSTDTLKARLERLNRKTPFNIEYNAELERVIQRFLSRRKRYMEELMTLGSFYFGMFEQELINNKVPLETKYLPIVESALNPRAKSRVGAMGLWQFMYATGRAYGLDVNSYVDERSDPVRSTKAAAKFLAKLYSMFGDWDLALAAYNSGPGNVSKAIRRSGGHKNYWNLRPFLPRETAGYVPAFYATLYISEYAQEHGMKPQKPEIPYFETDTVHIKQLITFEQIATVMDVEMELLRFFNPSYYLDIIPVIKGKNYALRLPTRLIGKFVANETAIYAYAKAELEKREKPLPDLVETDSKFSYKVKSGDYLGKIAKRFGVSVRKIKRWNGLKSDRLRIGQRLTIYPQKPTSPKKKKAVVKTDKKTYTVKAGDTLWDIAKKFPGISVQNIKDWNNISSDNVKVGTKLKMCNC